MAEEILVDAVNVQKIYHMGKIDAQALRGVTLQVKQGEFLAIVGPSGSGKTTFLNLIGALDTPTGGSMKVFGRDLSTLSKPERADLRLHSLGFVFQAYNLVPVLTARENVEFVLELQGLGAERKVRAQKVLEQLRLGEFADRRPNELSGGQQQRVAVARAVASRPRLVLADEPTANLDGENAELLIEMMRTLNREEGITFVFSTHDSRVVRHAHRIVRLEDGRLAADEPGPGQQQAPAVPAEAGVGSGRQA